MMSNSNIKTQPTKTQLDEIHFWLKDEYDKTHQGFYCNWSIIVEAFEKDRLITFQSYNKAVGFVVWRAGEVHIDIDIMEIAPHLRHQGIGRTFESYVSLYFKEAGFIALKLFCEPRESENFWRKLGFIKFPERGYSISDLTFYKPLKSCLEPVSESSFPNRIELWNCDPYEKNKYPPNWIWEIKNNLNPILHPVNCNWNLRVIINNNLFTEDKVKYVGEKKWEIDHSPFLYIRKSVLNNLY